MRTKPAILVIGANDTLFSYDLHIIDVMNNLRGRMDELDWMKILNKMMLLYNGKDGSILHELKFIDNKIELYRIGRDDTPIDYYNYFEFIYNKNGEFISREIYDELVDLGYKNTIEFTPVKFPNINSVNLLEMFNNFIVVNDDYKWSESTIVTNMMKGDNVKQILSWGKLGGWLNSQVEREQDNDLAIMLTLVSNDVDIDKKLAEHCKDAVEEKHKELIVCESRIVTLNKRIDFEALKELRTSGMNTRSNLGIIKLFDPNIFNKR